jgi:uncharacterized membrane protein YkvA (DUF1232 family)
MAARSTHPEVEDRTFWRKVAAVAGRVPFTTEVVAAYFAMRDRHTPWRHKAVLAGAIAYFIMPIDAIPDFILPMGYTDDAAAIAAAVAAASMSIREEHRLAARRALGLVVAGETADAASGTVPGEVIREG